MIKEFNVQYIKLIDYKLISDEEWQDIYRSLRELIPIYSSSAPSRKVEAPRCVKTYIQLTNGEYNSTETLDSLHLKRIKDILKNIRRPCKFKTIKDYVYTFNDLKELMKYEQDLYTKLVHEEVTYWEVWICK